MALRYELGLSSIVIALTWGAASGAHAQTLEEEQAGAESETALGDPAGDPAGGEAAPERLGDEQANVEEETPAEPAHDSMSPRELADTDYFFLGAMGRGIIIPGFIQSLFVDGGIDGFNPAVGLSFNYRRNNFNIVASVWWNNASADGYFRASGDPRTETEYIDVDLGVIFLSAAFLWSFPVDEQNIFAIELGFDLGFGFVYGDLVRTEAYESSSGANDFQPCGGPGSPANVYCEAPAAPDPCYLNNGGHYDCREPNWFTDGGDTPFIVPWLAIPHLAVRIKPIRQFQIRLDGGYGLYNFFFGGSLYYGF